MQMASHHSRGKNLILEDQIATSDASLLVNKSPYVLLGPCSFYLNPVYHINQTICNSAFHQTKKHVQKPKNAGKKSTAMGGLVCQIPTGLNRSCFIIEHIGKIFLIQNHFIELGSRHICNPKQTIK